MRLNRIPDSRNRRNHPPSTAPTTTPTDPAMKFLHIRTTRHPRRSYRPVPSAGVVSSQWPCDPCTSGTTDILRPHHSLGYKSWASDRHHRRPGCGHFVALLCARSRRRDRWRGARVQRRIRGRIRNDGQYAFGMASDGEVRTIAYNALTLEVVEIYSVYLTSMLQTNAMLCILILFLL